MNLDKVSYNLFKKLIVNQFIERDIKKLIPDSPVMMRNDLRNIPRLPPNKVAGISKSSGSTGEPLILEKTLEQKIYFLATNMLEMVWRDWDLSKNIAVINPHNHEITSVKQTLNPYLFGKRIGKAYLHPVYGDDLQEWIDSVPCDYLMCLPSIIKTLDVSKFIDVKSSSEMGGTMYSASEVGTIGIQCPDNPDVYHVMDNIIVEIDNDKNIIITDLAHPYIRRYMIGDKGEFSTCHCGRKSQVLNRHVLGRVRNMVVGPDGKRSWPLFGTIAYCDRVPNLKKFQAVQETQQKVVFKAQGNLDSSDLEEIERILNETLGDYYQYEVQIVDSFPAGKHEEFICLI